MVLFLSTVYKATEDEQVERIRKRPTTAQPRAKQIKRMFGSEPVKRVSIPAVGAVYNDKMGAVDIGDQLKESLGSDHRVRRGGWQAIAWHFLLETVLVNSFLLQLHGLPCGTQHKDQKAYRQRLLEELLERYAKTSQSRKRLRSGDEFTPYSQHKRVNRGKRGPCLACEGIMVGQQRKRKPRTALGAVSDDSLNQRKRGRMTSYGCDVCDTAICTSEQCWYFYHRQN